MRASLAILGAAFVAGAASQSMLETLDAMPACAISCVTPLLNITMGDTNLTSEEAICDSQDRECICGSKQFQGASLRCVSERCPTKDALVARNASATSCNAPVRDQSDKLLIVTLFFSIFAACFIIQRFLVKTLCKDLLLGLDDWAVLLAGCVMAPMAAIGILGGNGHGLGTDIWTNTPSDITDFLYYLWMYTTIYFVNIAVCKLAFLLFFLRVFPAPQVRSLLWATVGFVIVWGTFFTFFNTFQCKPVSYYWNRWDGEHSGTCINASTIAQVNGAISIGVDLWMVAIPLYQLRGVNLDWKKKISVGLMFGVGLFVTIVSAVRLDILVRHNWESPNQTWVKLDLAMWSQIEICVSIVCACLPSFRSMLVRLFPFLPLGLGTHRDNTNGKDDFAMEGNRDLGFGTISRSVAEKTNSRHIPIVPGAIGVSRSYKVEYDGGSQSSRHPTLGGGANAYERSTNSIDRRDFNRAIVRLPSLEEFNSSESTLDGDHKSTRGVLGR